MDSLRPILYHLQPLVLLGSPLPVPLARGLSHAAPNMFLKPMWLLTYRTSELGGTSSVFVQKQTLRVLPWQTPYSMVKAVEDSSNLTGLGTTRTD